MTASKEVPENILAALKSVIGESPASLHEPIFMGNEKAYLMDCIDSGFVSSSEVLLIVSSRIWLPTLVQSML